jgi:hypothetical protein
VLVFFQALGVEINRYRIACCALTDQEPVSGLIVSSLRKDVGVEYSHVLKLRYEMRHEIKKNRNKGRK